MYFALNFLLLVGTFLAEPARGQIVFYEELKDLNISCYPMVNCIHVSHNDESPSVYSTKPCSCNRMCSQFNTCCLGANNVRSKRTSVKPACRDVKQVYFESHYFMVDRCSIDGNGDSAFEDLCNNEQAVEDDLMRLVPVTSLFTSMTYKNYFCLRCHEMTDDFVYWNIHVKNNESHDLGSEMKRDQLVYSKQDKSWMFRLPESETLSRLVPVEWYLQIPPEITNLQVACLPNLISQCNNSWSDDTVREKCQSYMSYIEISKKPQNLKYRNPHCAVCNFENLNRMTCEAEGAIYGVNLAGAAVPFSFTHLLDVNPSDGNKVGKVQKCEDDSLWDPWAEKCRKVSCAIPGYIVQGQKCVAPP